MLDESMTGSFFKLKRTRRLVLFSPPTITSLRFTFGQYFIALNITMSHLRWRWRQGYGTSNSWTYRHWFLNEKPMFYGRFKAPFWRRPRFDRFVDIFLVQLFCFEMSQPMPSNSVNSARTCYGFRIFSRRWHDKKREKRQFEWIIRREIGEQGSWPLSFSFWYCRAREPVPVIRKPRAEEKGLDFFSFKVQRFFFVLFPPFRERKWRGIVKKMEKKWQWGMTRGWKKSRKKSRSIEESDNANDK